jgi:hypothetical protein
MMPVSLGARAGGRPAAAAGQPPPRPAAAGPGRAPGRGWACRGDTLAGGDSSCLVLSQRRR